MRVSLITTGRMELLALPDALKGIFPEHEFHAEPFRPGAPFPGFTSSKVRALASTDPSGNAAELLRAALGTIRAEAASARPSDIAVVLEDLELGNRGNEAVVVEHVRQSALRVIDELGVAARPEDVRRLLRERVSFHLAVPMPESWFFGEPAALGRAGVPEDRLPLLAADRDPEDFLTDDPAYELDDGSACTRWVERGRKLGRSEPHPFWLGTSRRREHPKAYLTWLARHPSQGDCTCYGETRQGARALRQLSWSTVLMDGARFAYLRAMVRDLERALGSPAVGVAAGGEVAPLTSRPYLSAGAVLRNV